MSSVKLLEAASRYGESLRGASRSRALAEVNRFVRWYGQSRLTGELRGHDVSLYADELGAATDEAKRKADHVRGFLAYLKKEGMTGQNLATHLRLRKSMRLPGSRAGDSRVVELTAEGHEALTAELETLKDQRPAVRDDIRRAMLDKDFRENSPLDAAKDKQAHLESRIREIDESLKHGVIVEKKDGQHASVQIGSTVRATNLGSGASVQYTIVGGSESDPTAGKITNVSPIGRALLGCSPGQEVEVSVPAGVLRFRVEEIEG